MSVGSVLAHAEGVVVDRIAAVVDLHAITRSAVEDRARPLLAVAKTEAQKAQVRRDVIIELIEDALILKESRRLRIEIREEEVDAALLEVARQNSLTLAELSAETQRQGLDVHVYRALLRRKLLELKWLNIRANRVAQPTDDAERGAFLASERVRLMQELRAGAVIEVRSPRAESRGP